MSNVGKEVFASHREVMEALQQNFAGNDDAQRVSSVEKLQQDLAAQCKGKESVIKATIAGEAWRRRGHFSALTDTPSDYAPWYSAELSQQAQQLQTAATPQGANDTHDQRVQSLLLSSQAAKENVNSLNQAARYVTLTHFCHTMCITVVTR